MKKQQTLGLIRHILTFAGGFVVADGWVDPTSLETLVGALVTIGGALWSVFSEDKKHFKDY